MLMSWCAFPSPERAANAIIADVGVGTEATFVADMPKEGMTLLDLRGDTMAQTGLQGGEVVAADALINMLGLGRATRMSGELAILGWRLGQTTKSFIVVGKADELLRNPNM
jgi:hypothetical protein